MMMPNESKAVPTVIAAADASSVRLFVRREPGHSLEELAILPALETVGAATTSRPDESDDEQILGGTPSHAFLVDAAASIAEAIAQTRAGRLVLCAPPHALCALRDGLSRATRRLLVYELPHSCVRKSTAEIDAWLRERLI